MPISAADTSSVQQAQVRTEVATAVARTVLDNQELQGQAAISLLEGAAAIAKQGPINPSVGQRLDASG